MKEEDLIKIWHSSPNQGRVTFEKSRLIVEVQAGLDRFHGLMKGAARRAMIVTWTIVAVFMFYTYIIPFTLSKIASGLVVLFAVNVFMRLRKVNKNEPKSFTGTYSEYLYKIKISLLDQKQLIDTALYWCIIPGISTCILFFLGFLESSQFTITGIIVLCVGCIVIGMVLFFLSKWWGKVAITPNLEKVDELINTLEEL